MAEEIDLEKCNFWNVRSPVTLTLTLERVIRHTVVHQSSTSYLHTKFRWNRKNFVDGGTDGRTYWRIFQTPSNVVIRSTRRSRRNNVDCLATSELVTATCVLLSYWRISMMSRAKPKSEILQTSLSSRRMLRAARSRCSSWHIHVHIICSVYQHNLSFHRSSLDIPRYKADLNLESGCWNGLLCSRFTTLEEF